MHNTEFCASLGDLVLFETMPEGSQLVGFVVRHTRDYVVLSNREMTTADGQPRSAHYLTRHFGEKHYRAYFAEWDGYRSLQRSG